MSSCLLMIALILYHEYLFLNKIVFQPTRTLNCSYSWTEIKGESPHDLTPFCLHSRTFRSIMIIYTRPNLDSVSCGRSVCKRGIIEQWRHYRGVHWCGTKGWFRKQSIDHASVITVNGSWRQGKTVARSCWVNHYTVETVSDNLSGKLKLGFISSSRLFALAKKKGNCVFDLQKAIRSVVFSTLYSSFFFCSCVYFCLYSPFNCISFHNSPDNSPFSHSVLPVLSLSSWAFQLHVSLWKFPLALI